MSQEPRNIRETSRDSPAHTGAKRRSLRVPTGCPVKQIAAREAIGLLRAMTRVLCVVGILAMVCTTVNVTRFATSRDVPWPIAALLDPLIVLLTEQEGTFSQVSDLFSMLALWGP